MMRRNSLGVLVVLIVGLWLPRPLGASIGDGFPNQVSRTSPVRFVASLVGSQQKNKVMYDEAKQGDFKHAKPTDKVAVRVNELGVHEIRGHGQDAKDDIDAFVFEVTAGKVFDVSLVGDAAEFKKLYAISKKGKVKEIAFASTNRSFRAARQIQMTGLAPGKYYAMLAFGPDGATGDWVMRIAPRNDKTPTKGLIPKALTITTAQKMEKVNWPGLITIFHGHNWGKDKKYVIAIKECGFGATGTAESQIPECRKHGLRAYVFIWPHEAATIPKKYKNDKTVLCYYLSDRIPPSKWGAWAAWETIAYGNDPFHPAMFTMNGNWGGMDYFCKIVRGRAMEYYHYHWDAGRQPHLRYHILEQYRQASINNGHIPICRVVETRAEDVRRTRQTIFTSMAYGVRGFRTGGRGTFDTKNRDKRGVPTRTKYGEEFKRINAAIRSYSPIFQKARSQVVYHTAPLPAGCKAAPKESWIKISGKESLVGVFQTPIKTKKGTPPPTTQPHYLLVANRDAAKKHTAMLTIADPKAQVHRRDKKTAKWVIIPTANGEGVTEVSVELEEGGGELLRVIRNATKK